MKRLVTLAIGLCLSLPVWADKTYTLDLSAIKANPETRNDLILKEDGSDWDEAIIVVNNVPDAERSLISLSYGNDNKKIVQPEADQHDQTLTYRLKIHLEQAGYAFNLFYKSGGSTILLSDIRYGTIAVNTAAGATGDGAEEDTISANYISALTNINFVGNNKFLGNLTPIINLGRITKLAHKDAFTWAIDINPYLGSDIDTRDSVSFIPALMLYGKAGLMLNNYFSFDLGEKAELTVIPAAFGLKFLPGIMDSNNIIIQHNLRTGIAFRYDNIFTLGAQYTHAWHNLTSESERFFKSTFGPGATDLDYLTVTGQFLLASKNEHTSNYIYFEWRGLLSDKRFEAFSNQNILTMGFRKDIGDYRRNATPAIARTPRRPRRLHHLF
jgi:hypothetical protein